jgi:hypothetical protein
VIRELAFFSDCMKPKAGHTFILTMLSVFIRLSLPFVGRYIMYGNPFGLNWDGILYTVAESMVTFMISLLNYTFVYWAFIEMVRKLV